MRYIQRKDRQLKLLETVDQAESKKEANYLLGEYMMGDPAGEYYISQRACKDWHKRG